MLALIAIVVAAACGRPYRAVPVRVLQPQWPTYLGATSRAGLNGPVSDSAQPVWRADVGNALTAPVVVSGPVLLATTGNRMVAAISTEDGEHYWERRLDGPVSGGVVHDGRTIFVATEAQQGKAFALDLARGVRDWQKRVGGVSLPPLLVGDTVVLVTDAGSVVALKAIDGEQRWSTRLAGAAVATPVPWGAQLFVPTLRDTLYALDRASGRIRARVALPSTVSAAPAISGDTLLLPLHSGAVIALALPGLETLATAELGAPVLAAPVAAGDGWVYVLTRDAELWRMSGAAAFPERLASLDGAARGSLALAAGRLLVGRLDGTLFLLRDDGAEVWRRKFDDAIWAPVTVADGAIYVPLVRGEIVKLR